MGLPNLLPLILGFIVFSFIVSSIFIIPFINLLYKLKFTRRKEGIGGKATSLFDKFHDVKAGTPTGGGLFVIAIVSILFLILFPLVSHLGVFIHSAHDLGSEIFIIFFTFISFGLIGILDDYQKIFGKARSGNLGMFFGLSRKNKLILQWIPALFIGFWLYHFLGIHFVHIPFINTVIDFGIFYIPLAATIVVFFTNAFNFTDGLDGLASGLLMIYLFAFIVIAAGNLDTPLSIFIALWLGGIISFLYFNTYPARVFLGDAGALSFGAMIAVIGLLTGNVATLFVIGGIFAVDALSSVIQIIGFKLFKRRIFPMAPVHHSFLVMGWPEPKIVMRAWLAGIILAILGLWLAKM